MELKNMACAFLSVLLAATSVAEADAMRLAQAPAMVAVRPRGGTDFESLAPVAGGISLRLARNERESVQIVVTPKKGCSLKNVRVTAEDLHTERRWWIGSRRRMAASAVKCVVTGYVKTREQAPYFIGEGEKRAKPGPGWWPDPILDFLDHADVADGDIQSFWVRVTCPEAQPAGTYFGALTVTADGLPPRRIPLTVRVNDFTLAKTSPLPMAITFGPTGAGVAEEGQNIKDFPELTAYRKDPQSPVNLWKRHEDEWTDFLADYFIMPDSLYYVDQLPRFDQLKRLKAQGRLGLFNLTYWGHVSNGSKAWYDTNMKRIKRAYAAAKEAGLADHAYVYGCDEMGTNWFNQINTAASYIKKEFPDLPVLTTTYDDSYGLSPKGLTSVDVLVPDTPRYDPEKADRARAAGKRIWWYIACNPRPPWANIYVESRPIEPRLLMGAMAVRNRPEGFLYYSTARWNSRRPIENGPFTDWDPRSFLTFHGDGSWFCAGPDGTPLATQRVENFRDGIEDFAYAKLLREKLAKHPGAAWSRQAERLLEVPQTVFVNMTNYTHSAEVVYKWRDAMAELIERQK